MTKYATAIAAIVVITLIGIATYLHNSDNKPLSHGNELSADFKMTDRKSEDLVINLADKNQNPSVSAPPSGTEPLSRIDRKMTKSLEKFKEKMAAIEPGSIAREREEIEALREESEARTIEPPTVEVVVDEYGNKMKKYTYENGIVRYGLM